MDVSLAFAVQDVPSEALAFSNKAEADSECRSKLNQSPWRPFRFLKMLRGGWEFQEGIAVNFLLVWCGRSATTLVAAGHKHKQQKKQLDSGSQHCWNDLNKAGSLLYTTIERTMVNLT
tara:strand:- start:5408 stop:5761 length:354 start_codon:yes stop_codon:yes gene_type:complete